MIGLPANLFYSTDIPTCILVFRAPGTKAEERRNGVLFIDASKRFTKAKNRHVLTEADIADVVTAYHSKFDEPGPATPVDPNGPRWGSRCGSSPTHREIVGERVRTFNNRNRYNNQAGRSWRARRPRTTPHQGVPTSSRSRASEGPEQTGCLR
nr:N-6 DNA methylase [Streptomyces cinnamoneus]